MALTASEIFQFDRLNSRAFKAQLGTRVAAELATNVTNIATNTADIATNVSDIATNTAALLQRVYYGKATYDFSADGGTAGAIALTTTHTVPDNAIITYAILEVETACTSAGGTGTIAFQAESAGDLLAAVDADTLSGLVDGVPDNTAANAVKMTAATAISVVIGTEDLTAGVVHCHVFYVLGD